MRVFMAKKINSEIIIKSAEDLVTPRSETRAGFITLALEKNYLAIPYIEEAKALKALANLMKSPSQLLENENLRVGLLTASGLSDKALNYLSAEDKILAIKRLIEEFLEPAGGDFVDELVYRYLLTKGDALGGKARNLAGVLGERKMLRTLISILNLAGMEYVWKDAKTNLWLSKSSDDIDIEKRLKGLLWRKDGVDRLLLMNLAVPTVNKNIDFIIIQGTTDELLKGKQSIIYDPSRYLALGELKGGFDPAGADEHWKIANSALGRIRRSFSELNLNPHTFFIGAAIENSMAIEIFKQLQSGELSNAANLSNDTQLTGICNWLLNL